MHANDTERYKDSHMQRHTQTNTDTHTHTPAHTHTHCDTQIIALVCKRIQSAYLHMHLNPDNLSHLLIYRLLARSPASCLGLHCFHLGQCVHLMRDIVTVSGLRFLDPSDVINKKKQEILSTAC